MTDARLTQFSADGTKVLQHLQNEFAKLQTGRANPAVFEHIDVDAYDQKMQLKAVASISASDGSTIIIQPWDKSVLGAIEKAILTSNMGFNPVNDGVLIRISLPSMTEERRKEMQKVAQKMAEEARISLRQHRQKAVDAIKQDKDEDVRNTLEGLLQKEVDAFNGKIDDLRKKKEDEMMKV